MKNLNSMKKRILLVGFGIIVLMGLFPSWVCGTQADDAAARFRETVKQLRSDKADFEAKQRGDKAEMERLRQENKDLRNRIQRESPVPLGIPASKLPVVAPTVPKEIATPAREKIRADAEKMVAGQGLDMREGSPDHHVFWQIVDNGGLPQELDGKPFNKLPFEEQVRWAVNRVKAGRPVAPPVAKVPTPTPGTLPPGVGQDREHPLPGGFGGARLSTLPPGIAPPPNQKPLPAGPAPKKEIDFSDIDLSAYTPKPPLSDATPIIILLILVILAVVCLVFYLNQRLPYEKQEGGASDTPTEKIPPQLTMADSQKTKPERPEPIEKQNAEAKNNNVSPIMIMFMVVGIIFHVGMSNFIEAKNFGYPIPLLSSVAYTIPMILFSLIFVWPIKKYITKTDKSLDIKNIVIALCIMAVLRMIAGS
jgi:hypothetical protein